VSRNAARADEQCRNKTCCLIEMRITSLRHRQQGDDHNSAANSKEPSKETANGADQNRECESLEIQVALARLKLARLKIEKKGQIRRTSSASN